MFGGNLTGGIETQVGGDGDDTLMANQGVGAIDILIGGRGNDSLTSDGSHDVLIGGQGDDMLAVPDVNFSGTRRLIGGNGTDTLRLDGSGLTLDLTAISNNRIVDIEQIDITGSGNNTLNLTAREVLSLSSHSNTLVVRRNASDMVNIGAGWTQQANQVIGPDTFEVFTQAAATLKIQLAAVSATILASFVNHVGYSGGGSSLDTGKVLAKEGVTPSLLSYDNLINASRGINGIEFDIDNLPGTPTATDFVFQVSPMGTFDPGANPVGSWAGAPGPSSVTVLSGSTDRVSIVWPDYAIANRWLRITVLANANTGLAEPEVYYIGHLLGETTGASGSVFTVSFADISPIRSAVGSAVIASSTVDIDKNGTVAFADISAMRPNVGAQLTILTIAAASGGGGEQDVMSSALQGNEDSLKGKELGLKGVNTAPSVFRLSKEAPRSDHPLISRDLAPPVNSCSSATLLSIKSLWRDQAVNSLDMSTAHKWFFAGIGADGEYNLLIDKQRTDTDTEGLTQAISLEWESIIEEALSGDTAKLRGVL